MKLYTGTDVLHAKPMSRGDYNILRGWTIPKDENPLEQGYVIERREVGHVTWIPKDVFEKTYSEVANDRIRMVDLKHDLLTTKYTGVVHEKDFKFNAPHLFRVYSLRDPEGSTIVGEVHFQEGPINEVGVNGVCNEDLIAMVICRLEHFNQTDFRCRENSNAITKLEEALLWLRKRTMGREQRGVEGTFIK
jgi:hypothetical protein